MDLEPGRTDVWPFPHHSLPFHICCCLGALGGSPRSQLLCGMVTGWVTSLVLSWGVAVFGLQSLVEGISPQGENSAIV